jgi:hypothetical protein
LIASNQIPEMIPSTFADVAAVVDCDRSGCGGSARARGARLSLGWLGYRRLIVVNRDPTTRHNAYRHGCSELRPACLGPHVHQFARFEANLVPRCVPEENRPQQRSADEGFLRCHQSEVFRPQRYGHSAAGGQTLGPVMPEALGDP